jgi:hypothetical protein
MMIVMVTGASWRPIAHARRPTCDFQKPRELS